MQPLCLDVSLESKVLALASTGRLDLGLEEQILSLGLESLSLGLGLAHQSLDDTTRFEEGKHQHLLIYLDMLREVMEAVAAEDERHHNKADFPE